MKIRNVEFLSVIAALMLATAMSNTAVSADQHTLLDDEKTVQYLNQASAIIFAPNLSWGSLLQLRGAYGSASFSRKAADGSWCDGAPLRLLFGDFEGESVDISNTGPVILMVMNPALADTLAKGRDVAGDAITLLDLDKATPSGLNDIDVLVTGSASAKSGVVLNPGRNILDDIFGASSIDNTCGHKSAAAAIAATN